MNKILFILALLIGLVLSNNYEFFTSFGGDSWNRTQNCYSYALNNSDSRPWKHQQPGYISGNENLMSISKKYYNCKDLIERVKYDLPNAKLVSCNTTCPEGMRKIAMAVDPKKDYHFYRKDLDGWSHKRGKLEPEKLKEGKVPWLIKRKHGNSNYHYKNFCSCFCINN